MFKKMDVVGARQPLAISGQGDEHWHGVFHEEVQLFERVSALLHCVHWEDGDRAAGMTFELTFSPDGQLDVDRGFILVNNTGLETGGQGCRVQALKIVGFTEDRWDELAQFVCPYWTDFLRGAVKGSRSRRGRRRPPRPSHLRRPPPRRTSSRRGPSSSVPRPGRTWTSSRTSRRERRPAGTRPSAWMADGSRFWSQLAKDWVQAWSYALDTLPEVARRRGTRARAHPPAPPGCAGAPTALRGLGPAAPRPLDGLVIPVPGLAEVDRPSSPRWSHRGRRAPRSPPAAVSVTVLEPADGTNRVPCGPRTPRAPRGSTWARCCRPGVPDPGSVQFYVSGAREPEP